jgi:putative transposase
MTKNSEPQIYRVENSLWERLSKLIPIPQGSGRRPEKDKECFEGIIYVMRTGCQWKELPKCYPPRSTVHDRLQSWRKLGLFLNLWKELLIEYDDLHGIHWEWLSGDTSFAKSPLGGKKNRPKSDRQGETWNKKMYYL